MGVTFSTCAACRGTYYDGGPDHSCNEEMGGCGTGYCSETCARLVRPGHERPLTWDEREQLTPKALAAIVLTCVSCRGELANDANLLAFVLQRAGMTREAAAADYIAAKGKA